MYVEVPHRRSHDHGSKSEFTKPKNELSIDKLSISNEIELKPVKKSQFPRYIEKPK